MLLYNTFSGKKESVKKTRKPLKLFVCGPTVYDTPHIGNARTYVTFDSLARYLRSQKYAITYVQNITDIDDKIIDRAQKEHVSWKKISRTYERIYHANEKALGIVSVNIYARATDYIPQIVAQVQTLIKKGFAYKTTDGYYFDIQKFPRYGMLSKRNVAAAEQAVSRIDDSITKHHKGDFALWKFSKPGEPYWKTPLGNGRPGWHIEDTAITESFFGPQYDMHGGALDLQFPHHEAEIAQQESASGKYPFVKLWIHTGFLLVQGKKMSKSQGNFISIDEFLKKFDARVFRYITLAHHYRSPIDYSNDLAIQSAHALESIQHFIWKIHTIKTVKKQKTQNINHKKLDAEHHIKTKKIQEIIKNMRVNFYTALHDDFNTPQGLAAIFSGISELDLLLSFMSVKQATCIQKQLLELLQTVGIELSPSPKIPIYIRRFLTQRELYRRNKQFVQADALRDKIHALGYNVEDTPWGAIVMPKHIFYKDKK